MPTEVERGFHQAMVDIYRRASAEAVQGDSVLDDGQQARRLEAARILLHAPTVSQGGTRHLWERNRLDLSVEAVMLKPEWYSLFSDAEREISPTRLCEYQFDPTLPDYEYRQPAPATALTNRPPAG